MIAWPLDGKTYTAEPIGAYNGTRTRGVFSADDCFRVTSTGGWQITLSDGLAWLKPEKYTGVVVYQKEAQSWTLPTGSGQQDRYFAVAIQLNKTTNEAAAVLKAGDYSADPVKPLPVQDAYYDEIIVATIRQRAGAVELTAEDITDERSNETMCGLMRDGVTGLPSDAFYKQASALIAKLEKMITQAAAGDIVDGAVSPDKLSPETKALFAPAYTYGAVDLVPGSPSTEPENTIHWIIEGA